MTNVEVLRRVLRDFATVQEAARLVGCGRSTVRRAVDAGRLEGLHVPDLGRLVVRDDLARWASGRSAARAA